MHQATETRECLHLRLGRNQMKDNAVIHLLIQSLPCCTTKSSVYNSCNSDYFSTDQIIVCYDLSLPGMEELHRWSGADPQIDTHDQSVTQMCQRIW